MKTPHQNTPRVSILVLGIMLVAGLSVVTEANALDRKRFPGTMCEQYGNGGKDITYHYGSVLNRSSSTASLECAVVRDRALSSHEILNAEVRVLDQSTSSNVTCWLDSTYRNSSGFAGWSESASTSGSSSDDQRLTFGNVPYSSDSHVYVYCNIPGTESSSYLDASGVVSYLVNES